MKTIVKRENFGTGTETVVAYGVDDCYAQRLVQLLIAEGGDYCPNVYVARDTHQSDSETDEFMVARQVRDAESVLKNLETHLDCAANLSRVAQALNRAEHLGFVQGLARQTTKQPPAVLEERGVLTANEWATKYALHLADDLANHFKAYGVDDVYGLVRLCMISTRNWVTSYRQ